MGNASTAQYRREHRRELLDWYSYVDGYCLELFEGKRHPVQLGTRGDATTPAPRFPWNLSLLEHHLLLPLRRTRYSVASFAPSSCFLVYDVSATLSLCPRYLRGSFLVYVEAETPLMDGNVFVCFVLKTAKNIQKWGDQ